MRRARCVPSLVMVELEALFPGLGGAGSKGSKGSKSERRFARGKRAIVRFTRYACFAPGFFGLLQGFHQEAHRRGSEGRWEPEKGT